MSFSLSFFPLPAPLEARSARARVTLLRGESFEVEAEGVVEKVRDGACTTARVARVQNRDIVGWRRESWDEAREEERFERDRKSVV